MPFTLDARRSTLDARRSTLEASIARLAARIVATIRAQVSPRYVPDEILAFEPTYDSYTAVAAMAGAILMQHRASEAGMAGTAGENEGRDPVDVALRALMAMSAA